MQPCRKNLIGQPYNSKSEISGISDTELSFYPLDENTHKQINQLPVSDKCTTTVSYISVKFSLSSFYGSYKLFDSTVSSSD